MPQQGQLSMRICRRFPGNNAIANPNWTSKLKFKKDAVLLQKDNPGSQGTLHGNRLEEGRTRRTAVTGAAERVATLFPPFPLPPRGGEGLLRLLPVLRAVLGSWLTGPALQITERIFQTPKEQTLVPEEPPGARHHCRVFHTRVCLLLLVRLFPWPDRPQTAR